MNEEPSRNQVAVALQNRFRIYNKTMSRFIPRNYDYTPNDQIVRFIHLEKDEMLEEVHHVGMLLGWYVVNRLS
jgi:hypothetical protein